MKKRGIRIIRFLRFLIITFTLVFFLVNIFYPLGYRELIVDNSEKYDLDPYLVASIINVESNFRKEAVSRRNARGLMQIAEITGNWASEELDFINYSHEDLLDPELNIEIGSWYLSVLNREFDGNLELILAAYNGGSGNVRNWLKDERYSKDGLSLHEIPFKETREYIEKVNRNYYIYSLFRQNSIYREDGLNMIFLNIRNSLGDFIEGVF